MTTIIDNEFIKNYKVVRYIWRDIFLYGCFNRDSYNKLRGQSPNKFDNEKRRILTFVNPKFIASTAGRAVKQHRYLKFRYNMFSVNENYLKVSYYIKKLTADKVTFLFDLLSCLSSRDKSIQEIILTYLENHDDLNGLEIKIYRGLTELADCGYINLSVKGKENYYRWSNDCFEDLTEEDFFYLQQLLFFFVRIMPLTVPGYFLQDTINLYMQKKKLTLLQCQNCFLFKGEHLQQIFEEETLQTLMTSIKEHSIITFEYKRQYEQSWVWDEPMLPIKLHLDRLYGRWYLIGLTVFVKQKRPVLTIKRVDRIGEIRHWDNHDNQSYKILKSLDDTYTNELYNKNTANSWNIQLLPKGNKPILVELILHLDKTNKNAVLERLYKEGHNGKIIHLSGYTYKYSIYVNDPLEMKPWIRTFMGYIEVLPSNEHDLKEKLEKEWEVLFKRYGIIK